MRFFSTLLLPLLPGISHALLVAENSPCESQCGNDLRATSGGEITCLDDDYGQTTYGAAFETCISCELSSTYQDTSNLTDVAAALYNMRYALAYCLYGFDDNPNVKDTQCLISFDCGNMTDTIETNNLALNDGAYSYCPNLNNNLIGEAKCSACLLETDDQKYLGNFVTILYAGCIQQPVPGVTLSLQGSPFTTAAVNITTPTPISLHHSNLSSGSLSLGAKVGISMGALVFLLFLAGFLIICQGRRRRRRVLAQKARFSYPPTSDAPKPAFSPPTPGGFFDSPQSARPFANAWGYPQDVKSTQSLASESPISPVGRQGRIPDWKRERLGPTEQGLGFEMVVGSPISHPEPMLQPSSMR